MSLEALTGYMTPLQAQGWVPSFIDASTVTWDSFGVVTTEGKEQIKTKQTNNQPTKTNNLSERLSLQDGENL